MGRAARCNPVAVSAKEGYLKPRVKPFRGDRADAAWLQVPLPDIMRQMLGLPERKFVVQPNDMEVEKNGEMGPHHEQAPSAHEPRR